MPIYFLVLEAARFHEQIVPALAHTWQRRDFAPCHSLCAALMPEIKAFAERYRTGMDETVVGRVVDGMPFDRVIWQHLVWEILLYAAVAIPEMQTCPDTLACLLGPDLYKEGLVERQQFTPIHQAHFGSRDLVFGNAFYRPDQAGFNDSGDVARLADFLGAIDPKVWAATDLACLPGAATEEDRAEELEFAREWFPSLRELYQKAREQEQVVVCEIF